MLTLPSSPKVLVKCLIMLEVFSLKYAKPLQKSIQDVLVPIKGVLILEVLANPVYLDVQTRLASCLSELIGFTTPNSPFEDEPMKKAF